MEKKIVCSGCDKEMKEAESTAYMNQYVGRIVYSMKQEVAGALAVHVHKSCRSKLPIMLMGGRTA